MPSWEERIDRSTSPLLVAEHVARYRYALPAIAEAEFWADLGCGNGVAASDAIGGAFSGEAMLVDNNADALSVAERELNGQGTRTLEADLSTVNGVEAVRDALLGVSVANGCITCFEVLEHLEDFSHLTEMLTEVVTQRPFTVVLSVPNDAFWSIHNPHHRTMWGGDALEEFRMTLPADNILAHQYPLAGTAIDRVGTEPVDRSVPLEIDRAATPSHYLLAFGAGAERLSGVASVLQRDLPDERAWERQRESDLAYFRTREEELERKLEDLQPRPS